MEVLALSFLIGVTLPIVRLAAIPAVLRRLGGAPEMALAGIVGLTAYYLGVAAVALLAPVLLLPLAIAAAGVVAFFLWRGRPSYGAARGLPPGSLRVAPVGPWVDPDYFARDAKVFGPIFKSTTFFNPTVCIVGLAAALDLFEHHGGSLYAPMQRYSRFIPRGFLRFMSDEDHARYAPILRTAVSASMLRESEAELASMVRAELESIGEFTAGRHDVRLTDMTQPIVLRMFLRLFFGIEPGDPDRPRLEALYRTIDPMRAWRTLPRHINAAVAEIVTIVSKERRARSFLATARLGRGDAVDETALKNLVWMCQTGATDTAALLAWVVWMLGTHPEWTDRVRASLDGRDARRVVQETLRMEQSEYILRAAERDIHWRGFVIPRGWRVRVCVRESHRDPTMFEEPDRFNPDRFLGDPMPPTRYAAFGAATARTMCLGPGVTLTCDRIFVEELVRGFDWTLVRNGEPEHSGVHRRPSSRSSILLAPRSQFREASAA